MESNTYIVAVFHTAFSKILSVFNAESVDCTIVGLNGDRISGGSDDSSGCCKGNMFIIDSGRIFSGYGNDTNALQSVLFQISDRKSTRLNSSHTS